MRRNVPDPLVQAASCGALARLIQAHPATKFLIGFPEVDGGKTGTQIS